jgi:hypothetical protein
MKILNLPSPPLCCLLISVSVGVFGCSSQPSESDGQRALEKKVSDESKKRIRLVTFKKTDGQQQELLGVKLYKLEYECEIEFLQDCKWLTTGILGGGHSGFQIAEPTANQSDNSKFNWNQFLNDTQNPGTPMKKGERQKIAGAIVFEQTEKGWRSTDAGEMKLISKTEENFQDRSRSTKSTISPEKAQEGCIMQLRTIEGAKATWWLEMRKKETDVPVDTDLFGEKTYIRQKPQCPAGGTYKLNAADSKPTCSVPGHEI